MLRRLGAWWFAPAPAERLAALRILLGGYALAYVWYRFGELAAIRHVARFAPVGVTRILEEPLGPTLVMALVIVTIVLLAAVVVGFQYRVTAPLAAVALLWVTSYRNSWGMVFHTENLMALHVIALACLPAADRWALAKPPATAPPAGYGWGIKLLVALTAATYLLAGIAKLRIAGLDWIDGELLRNQIAIDNLRKALLGDAVAPLGTQFLEHPSYFTGFCALTLLLELGAPIALLGGRLARAWALAAWGFHVGVVLLMNIWFLYPLMGAAFVPILHAERPMHWLIGRVAAWRGRSRVRPPG
ncbi:MAG: hypothetical protein M3680_15030 [Myxococcota bacterium]|nr:hypothetical protein [Myxococcota bacterium]